MKYYRIAVILLGCLLFSALLMNKPAHAQMSPANPDSTTTWEKDSNLQAFSILANEGPVIADISHWQGTINWEAASKALDLVIIRTQSGYSTEDSTHVVNENAAIQYNVPFGVYAYNRSVSTNDAKWEAQYFYNRANKNALFYVIDVEEDSSKSGESMRDIINAYVTELRKLTNKKIGVYIAHHKYESLNIDTSKFDFVWIPRYSASSIPPNYAYDLWQYTDQGTVDGISTYVDLNRLSPNISLDFLTGAKDPTPVLIDYTKYYLTNPQKVVMLKKTYEYTTPDPTAETRGTALNVNTIVTTTDVVYTAAGVPRLKMANGNYIGANRDYVRKVISNIDQYYTTNPQKVVMLKKSYEYTNPNLTAETRGKALNVNTIVTTTGIVYTVYGVPRLKLANGNYMGANKDYVRKVISTIDQYYTTPPKAVIIKGSLYEYKSTNFIDSNKVRALTKNSIVNIAGITYTASGTPRLKTTKGTYITANKAYVVAK